MCEDLGLCSYEKHHKLKILQFLSSMRSYRDLLIKKGFSVDYYACQNNFEKKYEDKLEKSIKKHKINKVSHFEIEDTPFEKRIKKFIIQKKPIQSKKLESLECSFCFAYKNIFRI